MESKKPIIDIEEEMENSFEWGEDFGWYIPKERIPLIVNKALSQALNHIITRVGDEIKTIAMYVPNCDDHTPYRGACISCGKYDNPDILIGEKVDKDSLEEIKQSLKEDLGI